MGIERQKQRERSGEGTKKTRTCGGEKGDRRWVKEMWGDLNGYRDRKEEILSLSGFVYKFLHWFLTELITK